MKLIRSFLKWVGSLIGLLGLCFLMFFVLFIYPRPSRLPDPLNTIRGDKAIGEPQRIESNRLVDPSMG